MDAELVRRKKQEIVERHGPWSTPVALGFGVNGYDGEDPTLGTRLRRMIQLVEDVGGPDLSSLRILDLACLEGMFAVELARRGAKVVGIEGREGNIARARFAKELLGLANLELVKDDVRNLSRATYGEFDIVLCLGILYHLDAPDVFHFARRVAEVTRKAALFDTAVSLREKTLPMHGEPTAVQFEGTTYWGRPYTEHYPGSTLEERLKPVWASLDNPTSFWFTPASLYNLLSASGFRSILECRSPRWIEMAEARMTLLAFPGRPITMLSGALANPIPEEPWPPEEWANGGA